MAISNPTVWSTSTAMAALQETDALPNFWTNLLFGSPYLFDTEEIKLEKVARDKRKIAPTVTPWANGVPIYEKSSTLESFKPSYFKLSDPVDMKGHVFKKRIGTLLNQVAETPSQKRAAIKADIQQQQRNALALAFEKMAADLVLNGVVTTTSNFAPSQSVNFGRAAGHTVTLGSGARWGDSGISIYDLLQNWGDTMALSVFGGAPSRLIMGRSAWKAFRNDAEIKAQLDLNVRGTAANVEQGLLQFGEKAVNVGSLNGVLQLWVYDDYYEVNGSPVKFMDPRDVVLIAPNFEGIKAHGLILDERAPNDGQVEIFSHEYAVENDNYMTQMLMISSFIAATTNPNTTFRARVVA